jgi:hypothetical protein
MMHRCKANTWGVTPDMFYRIEVLVNNLKALDEKVEDNDFFHKFLRCLPTRFNMLVTLLVRTDLDTKTPNQILGDIMTDDAYRNDDEKEGKKEKKYKKKDEKKKKKNVAFKAISSSKGKAMQDTSSEDNDSSFDDMDDEKMAISLQHKHPYCNRCVPMVRICVTASARIPPPRLVPITTVHGSKLLISAPFLSPTSNRNSY